eukprot:3449577-Amphidinium_carterae.1
MPQLTTETRSESAMIFDNRTPNATSDYALCLMKVFTAATRDFQFRLLSSLQLSLGFVRRHRCCELESYLEPVRPTPT